MHNTMSISQANLPHAATGCVSCHYPLKGKAAASFGYFRSEASGSLGHSEHSVFEKPTHFSELPATFSSLFFLFFPHCQSVTTDATLRNRESSCTAKSLRNIAQYVPSLAPTYCKILIAITHDTSLLQSVPCPASPPAAYLFATEGFR